MPTINSTSPVSGAAQPAATSNASTTSTNAAGAAASAGQVTSNSTASTATDVPPAPSAGAGASPPKAKITGLAGLSRKFDTFGLARGAPTIGTFPGVAASRAVDRGYIKCHASPIPGGCRLRVDTFHSAPNDDLTLVLQAEVLDLKTNDLRTVNLAVLADGENLNGNSFRGCLTVDLPYADIEKFLQARNPKLSLNPGSTSLYVAAIWHNDSDYAVHRAGGPARGGGFHLPKPPDVASPTTTRIRASSSQLRPQADLPLDMSVTYPDKLLDAFPALNPNGSVLTRLESELKGMTDEKTMVAAAHRMYELAAQVEAGDRSGVQALLGKDWTISTVSRYWLKDDGSNDQPGKPGEGFFSGFRVDDDGLPIQDPMDDVYMDDADLSMTQHQGALRLRSNKQATVINVKPGGGRRDPKTGITQRVEVGLQLCPDTTRQRAADLLRDLATSDWKSTCFNHAASEVAKLEGTPGLAEMLEPWLQITQDRHKFTLKNEKTGVEIEVSFDEVNTSTLRPEHAHADGTPRKARFFVLEAELDHLQLNSGNQASFLNGANSGKAFETDAAQDKWLESTSDEVTLDVQPRLHELEDLENESFRQTDSYRAFEKANAKLLSALFPKGLGPGKQKAAQAAEALGLVPISADAVVDKLRYYVSERAGVEWSDELDALVRELAADPEHPALIEQEIRREPEKTVELLKRVCGVALPELRYDTKLLKARIAGALHEVGLAMTPEAEQLVEKIEIHKISPAEIHELVDRLDRQGDSYLFDNIAAKLGLPTVAPKVAVDGLEPLVRKTFEDRWVDPACVPDCMRYLAAAAEGEVTARRLRNLITGLNLETLTPSCTDEDPPKLKLDPTLFKKAFVPLITSKHILLDQKLESFLDEAAAKLSVKDATRHHSAFQSQADSAARLASIAESAEIELPKLEYDSQWVNSHIEKVTPEYVVCTPEVKEFALALIEAGNSPWAVGGFVGRLLSNGLDYAQRQGLELPDDVELPQVKVDLARLLADKKKTGLADMTDEQEKFITTTLPEAIAKPDFKYQDLHSAFHPYHPQMMLKQVLSYIKLATGKMLAAD